MRTEDVHTISSALWKRIGVTLAAALLLGVMTGCALAGVGIQSGAIKPPTAHRRAGPVQLSAFVLCRSRNTFDPCVSGQRTYEVWLLVDWKRIGAGAARSYRLVNMALN